MKHAIVTFYFKIVLGYVILFIGKQMTLFHRYLYSIFHILFAAFSHFCLAKTRTVNK